MFSYRQYLAMLLAERYKRKLIMTMKVYDIIHVAVTLWSAGFLDFLECFRPHNTHTYLVQKYASRTFFKDGKQTALTVVCEKEKEHRGCFTPIRGTTIFWMSV